MRMRYLPGWATFCVAPFVAAEVLGLATGHGVAWALSMAAASYFTAAYFIGRYPIEATPAAVAMLISAISVAGRGIHIGPLALQSGALAVCLSITLIAVAICAWKDFIGGFVMRYQAYRRHRRAEQLLREHAEAALAPYHQIAAAVQLPKPDGDAIAAGDIEPILRAISWVDANIAEMQLAALGLGAEQIDHLSRWIAEKVASEMAEDELFAAMGAKVAILLQQAGITAPPDTERVALAIYGQAFEQARVRLRKAGHMPALLIAGSTDVASMGGEAARHVAAIVLVAIDERCRYVRDDEIESIMGAPVAMISLADLPAIAAQVGSAVVSTAESAQALFILDANGAGANLDENGRIHCLEEMGITVFPSRDTHRSPTTAKAALKHLAAAIGAA